MFFSTLLFFPNWPDGLPNDLYLLHLFFFIIFIPFTMIYMAARSKDRQNKSSAEVGYKDAVKGLYYGYEYRDK